MEVVEAFIVAYSVGAAVMLVLAGVAYRNRRTSGARTLIGVLLSVAFWLTCGVANAVFRTVERSLFVGAFQLVGLGLTIAFLFAFSLEYAGHERWLSSRTYAALAVEPILVTVLALTNAGVGLVGPPVGGHHLVYGTVDPTTGMGGIHVVSWGAFFWVHLVYSYLLVFASTVLVVTAVYRSNQAYRAQGTLVVAAILAPWFANALDVFVPGPDNLLAFGFCASGVLLTLGVLRYGLTDVAPVARNVVVDTIGDPVLVFDRDERIVDANPAARTLLGIDGVGRHATAIPAVADVHARFDGGSDLDDRRLTVEGPDETHVFDVTVETVGEDDLGRVFVLHDVTDVYERQRKLERQTERLDRFAGVVTHDLRNPLSIAQGYLDLLEDSGELDHVDKIRTSHERMEALVDDVLTMARQGDDVTDPEPTAIARVARRAWETADTRAATLHVRDDATATADPDRLLQLFENLYRNAVDHGDDDGTVTVGVLDDGFFVADDGPGIPKNRREKVLEDGYTTRRNGTGFGLSIVTSIATSHGWMIDVCESETGGSRFEFHDVDVVADSESGASA